MVNPDVVRNFTPEEIEELRQIVQDMVNQYRNLSSEADDYSCRAAGSLGFYLGWIANAL